MFTGKFFEVGSFKRGVLIRCLQCAKTNIFRNRLSANAAAICASKLFLVFVPPDQIFGRTFNRGEGFDFKHLLQTLKYQCIHKAMIFSFPIGFSILRSHKDGFPEKPVDSWKMQLVLAGAKA